LNQEGSIQSNDADAGTPIISVRNLSFRYDETSPNILESVDLQIARGEIVLIAGRSGSGKSTLLRSINGLIPHQHAGEYTGSVIVDGLEVSSTRMSELAKKVGYIFQNPENQIFMFSVERDVAFGLENLSLPSSEIRKKVNWALDVLGIGALSLRAPHELSDGQKQRVAIAGAIVMGQKILILDEPTSLLDPYTAQNLIELVKKLHDELDITVLIVEHRLDLVSRIANRLVVLDRGRVVHDGKPRDILYSSNMAILGVNEPTIVRTAKLLRREGAISQNSLPVTSSELSDALRPESTPSITTT
jgi:energy-coupling factor transporter ATP-binding protein EcfA2